MIEDGVEYDAKTSENRLYVTLGDAALSTFPDESSKLLETFLHISCPNASGAATEADLLTGVWAEFQSLEVTRWKGQVLGYHRESLCPDECGQLTAEALIAATNGQCGAWDRLFRRCLEAHGITGAQPVVVGFNPNVVPHDCFASSERRMLIREYLLPAAPGETTCANYPFSFNVPVCNNNPAWEVWQNPQVTDLDGVPAQGTTNPASWFKNHQITVLDGLFYDASYGRGPFGPGQGAAELEWEEGNGGVGALAGWVGEAQFGTDPTKARLGARKQQPGITEIRFILPPE